MSITVLIADDDETVVDSLAEVVGSEPGLEVVALARDGSEAIELAARHRPDVAILDVRMPEGGPTAALGVVEGSPDTKVLALSAEAEPATICEMMGAGTRGYVVKTDPSDAIIDAVYRCAEDRPVISEAVSGGFAEHVADHLVHVTLPRDPREAVIRGVIDDERISIVLQPIVDLSTEGIVGVEALARFDGGDHVSPGRWFGDAAAVGLLKELEIVALRAALDRQPDDPRTYLSVNVSPSTAVSEGFARLLDEIRGEELPRLVLELTEREPVDDYAVLTEALTRWRRRGARIAIDDVGAGISSFRHIVAIDPNVLKIDMTLVRGLDRAPLQRAAVDGIVRFAAGVGATTVAEGIEERSEVAVLRELGVDYGQGYLFGRPEPSDDVALLEGAVGLRP